MQPLPASILLDLWERGQEYHPLDRALALIAALGDAETQGALADLPLAERDRRLFQVNAALFGPEISLEATCDTCGGETALTFSTMDLLAGAALPDSKDLTLALADRRIAFRLPTSRDLAAALGAPSADSARTALLAGLLEAGVEPTPEALDALDAALLQVAGLESLTLNHVCADCAAETATPFDILDYLWRRISARAQQLMRDIHLLAKAYGWTSAEILSLSDRRRAAHIAMVVA